MVDIVDTPWYIGAWMKLLTFLHMTFWIFFRRKFQCLHHFTVVCSSIFKVQNHVDIGETLITLEHTKRHPCLTVICEQGGIHCNILEKIDCVIKRLNSLSKPCKQCVWKKMCSFFVIKLFRWWPCLDSCLMGGFQGPISLTIFCSQFKFEGHTYRRVNARKM